MDQKEMLVALLKDLATRWQMAIEDAAYQGSRLRVQLEEKDSGDVEILLTSAVEETSGLAIGLTLRTTLLTLKELETVLHYIKDQKTSGHQAEDGGK